MTFKPLNVQKKVMLHYYTRSSETLAEMGCEQKLRATQGDQRMQREPPLPFKPLRTEEL